MQEFKMPIREQNSHKGTFGKVLNFCGSKNYIGAAYLSTKSSLKVGAGLSALASEKQIIWASRVMKANEDANAKGLGVFSLDGKMVDKPVLDRARKILAKAKKFGAI